MGAPVPGVRQSTLRAAHKDSTRSCWRPLGLLLRARGRKASGCKRTQSIRLEHGASNGDSLMSLQYTAASLGAESRRCIIQVAIGDDYIARFRAESYASSWRVFGKQSIYCILVALKSISITIPAFAFVIGYIFISSICSFKSTSRFLC